MIVTPVNDHQHSFKQIYQPKTYRNNDDSSSNVGESSSSHELSQHDRQEHIHENVITKF